MHIGSGTYDRRRIRLFISIFVLVLAVIYGSIWGFYRIALGDAREHLIKIAQTRAELTETIGLESVAEYGTGEEATAITLTRIGKARAESEGLGQTGEFTIAHADGDQIVFLFVHRSFDHDLPQPIPADSGSAEAMQRAVGGASGTMIGDDYRGVRVLAAYEPIPIFGWGLVAQIDLAEVGAPFRHASWLSALIMALVVMLGAYASSRVTRPRLRRIGETERKYQELVETMSDGFAIQGKDQRLSYVNDRYCEILGRDRRELIGHPTDEFMTEESQEHFRQIMERRREGVAESYEVTFIRPDESHVHVRSAPRPSFGPKGEYKGSFAVHKETPLDTPQLAGGRKAEIRRRRIR